MITPLRGSRYWLPVKRKCDIAFALGGGLFGFGLAQFQPGSNVMLPTVILISGLALLMFSAIIKHNV
jgi:hypothetical protein